MKKGNTEVGPLVKEDGIIPLSDTHRKVMERLNSLPESDLVKQLEIWQQKSEEVKEEKKDD